MRRLLLILIVFYMGWFVTPALAQEVDDLRKQVQTLKAQLERLEQALEERTQEQQRALEKRTRQQKYELEALKAKQDLEILRAQQERTVLREEIRARPRTGFLSRGPFGPFKVDFSGYIKMEAISSSAILAGGDLILADAPDRTTLGDKYKFQGS